MKKVSVYTTACLWGFEYHMVVGQVVYDPDLSYNQSIMEKGKIDTKYNNNDDDLESSKTQTYLRKRLTLLPPP